MAESRDRLSAVCISELLEAAMNLVPGAIFAEAKRLGYRSTDLIAAAEWLAKSAESAFPIITENDFGPDAYEYDDGASDETSLLGGGSVLIQQG